MLYEVNNPSDPISFECEDDTVAAVAGLFLGEGFYGVEDEQGKRVLPVLAFGGEASLQAWLKEQKLNLDEFMAIRSLDVAACLESTMVAQPGMRAAVLAAIGTEDPNERLAAIRRFNDKKRSSLNDIAARAHAMAKALRLKTGKAAK
jgi:hypothetical protein